MMEKYAKRGDKEMPPHPILLVIGVIIIYGMKRVRINLSLYRIIIRLFFYLEEIKINFKLEVNQLLAKRKPQKSF